MLKYAHNIVIPLNLQLLAEYSDISPEILKLGMFLADLMNGIIYQISNLVTTEARTFGLLATLLPGFLFLLGATIYLIVAPFTIWSDFKNGEIAKLVSIGISSIFGLAMYLIADNFYIIEEIRQD